jgi:hypothetical protein
LVKLHWPTNSLCMLGDRGCGGGGLNCIISEVSCTMGSMGSDRLHLYMGHTLTYPDAIYRSLSYIPIGILEHENRTFLMLNHNLDGCEHACTCACV